MLGQFVYQYDFSRTAELGLIGVRDKSQLKELLLSIESLEALC